MKLKLIINKSCIVFSFICLTLLFSCNKVDYRIQNIEEDIINIESNIDSVDENMWIGLENKMAELTHDLEVNRKNYSAEQIKEVGRLQGRFVSLSFRKGLEDFKGSVNLLSKKFEGFIEGIQNNSSKEK